MWPEVSDDIILKMVGKFIETCEVILCQLKNNSLEWVRDLVIPIYLFN